jgi:AbrB family looped-hinge helix DNA binding protein
MKNGTRGKYLFGIAKVGEKGQIVIPKDARDVFDIKAGDSLIILGDVKKGLALVKADVIADKIDFEEDK